MTDLVFNFFQSTEHLEPHCPKCDSVIDYGVTTKYDDKEGNHVCLKCGMVLK